MSKTLGAPSMSHLPYISSMPRSCMDAIVSRKGPAGGSRASTSTAACIGEHGFANSRRCAYRVLVQRSDQSVPFPIFRGGDWSFRLEYRVDATHCTELAHMSTGVVRDDGPRFATSVAISNSKWFLMSLFPVSPFMLAVESSVGIQQGKG
jgi:hypothetical protein